MKIPNNLRKDVDALKDDTVVRIFIEAERISSDLKAFKSYAFEEINTYMEILGDKYNVKYTGKGNISLTNYDNTLKIIKAVHDFIEFDEKLQIAKSLIDKCIHKWSSGANENIKVLVGHAFEVDKKGKVSTDRVLGLRRLDIKDEDWTKAMEAITDSLSTISSKSYIRLYKRADEYSEWSALSLDISSVG